ncbi:hypothetical protein BVRB_7g166690 [Beta vulgaris subsp. vulgaris]|nr:hypothetical protein BVRB_7g166690 [Beta vulgaris subsp. vulgaris]
MSSFFLGVYAGVVVHQEHSLRMGLAYIIAVVSPFDDMLMIYFIWSQDHAFPARPRYRRNANSSLDSIQRKTSHESEKADLTNQR